MGKINLKEELLKIDRQTNFKYTLTDLYEACMLDEKKKGKLVQYIEDRDIPSMSSMLSNEAGVMAENVGDDLTDEELNEWAPSHIDCPACGDTSFDTKKGRCTKCSYRESMNEWFDDEDEDDSEYEYVRRKTVLDSDGFTTDYTWYRNKVTGLNVFVFGDNEVYTPADGYFDFETDSDEEAEEWFNSYNGFADDDDLLDEGIFAVAGDALGKGVKDLWQGAKNFGKGLRDTGRDMAKTAKAVGNSIGDEFKQSKNAAKMRDVGRALKGANNVDEFKADYRKRQEARRKSNVKRNHSWGGRQGKSIGDVQDWVYVIDGKKYSYDEFIKLPGEQRKKAKKYDLSSQKATFADQKRRLNASWIREGRQLNEGPGAGYSIETSGYTMSGTLNGFTMSTQQNRWGNTEYVFDCVVNLTGEVETFYAEAAYSHTGVQHNLPIVCDHVTLEVGDDGLVSLGIFSEDNYENGNLSENSVDKNGLYETIIDALSGARCSFTYGGGWSHASYDGQVTEDYLSDVYLADVEASIYLADEEDIRKVDRMTQGYGYETIYMVGDPGDYVEGFEDEDEAIAYAKENGYTEVRISYESEDWEGNVDSEYGQVVWEANEDVDESLNETFNMSINLDEVVTDVANMLDVDVLGEENWIEVFPTVDVRPLMGGGSYVALEITGPGDDCRKATFTAKGGCVNVQFRNGSEAKCYGADEIARFIAGEFGVTLNESLKEAVGGAKTFSQWFDETSSDSREEFYPFSNYVKTFPNAEVLANATAEDIKNNAHKFYDVYDVDSDDREKAFHFASEELDMDYDDFYYAWLKEKPISNKLKEDWTHFEFKSGSNPYIAKDEKEKNRILKKYGNKAKEIKPNYYMIDDSEGDRDLFSVEEEISSVDKPVKFQGKSSHTFTKDKKWDVDFDEVGNISARTRHGKPHYFKGHINDAVNDFPSTDEDNIILAAREQHGLKFGGNKKGELSEAFTPAESGVQSVKVYNQYNYTIQELRIDNDAKTFERGNFTMGKPDKKFKNRQQYEDLVDQLKELGYTEISSDYQSLRNKSRKGVPTNEATLPRNASRIRTTDRVSSTTRNMTKDSFGWRDDESGTYYSPNHIRKYHDVEVTEIDPNYKPKRTKQEYVVQGNYGYGWDDLTTSDSYGEAKQDLKDYRENEKNATHRLITRRVPINESKNDSVTRYQMEFYLPEDEDRRTEYVYAESKKEATEKLKAKVGECTVTGAIPETVPAKYKQWDMGEAFEHPQSKGPFWYLCKHGIGPGAIPKGVTVLDTIDDEENPYRCYVALDKVLTTDELKQFEMKEQKPPKMMSEAKHKRSDGYKGIKERLNEADEPEYIKFEIVPDNRKWQYSVGGKDVPYTSYEDAIDHLKDDYNIMDYRDELQSYLKANGNNHYVDATWDDRLCVEIHRGDWKHDHGNTDYLVREFFSEKGLGVRVEEVDVVYDCPDDSYSSTHCYEINDIWLSGRVINEAFDGYEIKNVKGHFEVYKDGKFILSADTQKEAEEEIQEMENDK